MNRVEEIKKTIQADIKKHPVVLYMKGTKLMPQCGFSSKVVHILNKLGVAFETRNVLEDEALRQAIKEFSDWPTIPQLYINQQFIGGCDIVSEMYASGDLQNLLSIKS